MGLRHVAALALIAAASTGGGAQTAPTTRQAVAAARAYLAAWQDTLTNLIADESYLQELSPYRGGFTTGMTRSRRLTSEVLLVRAPAENIWLSFRDVMAVDGTPVGDRQQRFATLFSGPVAMLLTTAERIANESARFNIGSMTRTINTPTAALVFLHPLYEGNTTWALDANERREGQPVWELRFAQRKPPFAVRVPSGMTHSASGRFRVVPATGQIIDSELSITIGRSRARVRTLYGPVPGVAEGWVPLRMQDDYEMPRIERLRGEATYTNHRLFRTAGRVIG